MEDYAQKNGFTNIRHFTDDGVRGTTFKRPGLDAMLEEIRAGNVATVIIKDQSRIGRDVVEVGLLKRTFDEYHVRFIAANDNLDTANGFDIMSIFRDVINEWYVADTSRKIKTVFKSRMEKGLRCSGSVSYGYLASKENKGEWVIDEEAAAVVRRIFHSVVAGESIASIARALRAEKIPIPSEHWKRIGAPVRSAKYTDPYAWSTTTISYNAIGIVANENKYHPIRDYLNTLVWDGTERIRFCLRHFLGADADDYTYEALKLFLLGAISRAFQPGCKFEIMLCLVGGQGAGKSTFFRLLAVRDEWFSDDLRKLDDDNVYRKLQGHWIIEMSEMMATANAKSIEEIKSFLSRQKEVYKIPYETHPADRPRQCVFGGTSNALDFLPLDRSGNRRFIPVMVYPEQAEVHILEDEAASRAYIEQMWAEAMEIYRSGRFKLAFSPDMQRYLKEHQRDFMPEDTKAGMIQAYLDRYTGSMVCSKQLYKEALNHAFDEPKQWEIREINEIMNQCIDRWRYFPNPRMFSEYGRQKGWERENPATDSGNPSEKAMDGFVEVTEQMELPF